MSALRIAAKDFADYTESLHQTEPHRQSFGRHLETATKKKDSKMPALQHETKAASAKPEEPTVSRTQTAEPTRRIPKITDVDDLIAGMKQQIAALQQPTAAAADDDEPLIARTKTTPQLKPAEIPDETVIVDPNAQGTMPPPFAKAASPIEEAIHALISGMTTSKLPKITDRDIKPAALAAATIALSPERDTSPHTATANAVKAPAPIAEPRAIPEQLGNPSHVHLVVGDDAQRVVVTVAVRGSQVQTTLRTADDATASALSRNAASLDDAMRARGLELSDLDASRDDSPPQQHQHHHDQDQDDE